MKYVIPLTLQTQKYHQTYTMYIFIEQKNYEIDVRYVFFYIIRYIRSLKHRRD